MPETSREIELLRRVASAYATLRHLHELMDEDALEALPKRFDPLPGLLSALDHDLSGTEGCLDPDEWNVSRRAHAVHYQQEEGVRPLPDSHMEIAGVCPMGCGETLFLGAGAYVTCSYVGCPNPSAAAELLSPEASAQSTQEAVTSTSDRFKLEAELDVMRKHVSVLLESLKDEWWLDAGIAYEGLHRMLNPPKDVPDEG